MIGATAAPYVIPRLRELDAALLATIPRVLHHATDEEAIHDMRVAIRRLRTILKLARQLFGRFHADAVRGAFAEVMRATGALRDEEVLEETLAALPVSDRAFHAWRARRKRRERALRREVTRLLRAGDLERARKMLEALLVLPVKPSRDVPLDRFARRAVDRARKEVEARRDVPTSDVEGLHQLRIAFKHLRYAAEILGDALPIDLAAMAKPAAAMQKRLGEIHDVDVAKIAIERARGLSPVTRARVLRALTGAREHRVAKYLAEAQPAPPTA